MIGTIDKGCWWHLSGCGIRNQAFLEIGDFEPDLDYSGDWEWSLRCLASGHGIWYLPRSTMLYREHAGSISSRSIRRGRDVREALWILRAMRERGFLSVSEYEVRVRRLIRQTARRTITRAARADIHSLFNHWSLLVDMSVGYIRGRTLGVRRAF